MSEKIKMTFEDIVFKSSLYQKILFKDIDIENVEEYVKTEDYSIICSKSSNIFASMQGAKIDFEGELKQNFLCFLQSPKDTTIDCYCQKCNKIKSFLFQLLPGAGIKTEIKSTLFINLRFKCITCKEENLYFSFMIDNESIEKIGEYPSKYSLAKNETAPYRTMLGEHFDEYNKAIIVHSLGFSIAGFTYLRRIFEKIIFEFFEENKKDLGIKFEDFKKSYKEDQFKILKPYFPDWINSNKKTIYGILSVHIHELTEESAIGFFPLIKRAIDIVVKYRFESIQASKEEKEVEKELRQAHIVFKK